MFLYLSKKIAIPNDELLTTLSWSSSKDYIACGGENGLLKVLKLDPQSDGNVRGIAAPTTLTMNETLDEHKSNITMIVWNEKFDKMTTADKSGIIIVWLLFKGQWHQEMINNTCSSRVNGMKWNVSGEKICIVYEEGSIIVGSVDGSRLWGKTIPNHLSHVEWSPDSRLLLFGLVDTPDIHIYDCGGTYLNSLKNYCTTSQLTDKEEDAQQLDQTDRCIVISIDWYKGSQGYMCKNCPCLAVCYSNGCCQIMRSESDSCPILINTGIKPRCMTWNGNGTILAIAGLQGATELTNNKESNVIQFYNCFGFHLRTLKIPSKQLHACSFDGDSLRIAVAVDSSIYFANIRPCYMWAYLSDTVVYAVTRPDRINYFVTFWNVANESKYTKTFGKLKGIISNNKLACVLSKPDTDKSSNEHTMQVCNTIGTSIDSKSVPFEPLYYCMTNNQVILSTDSLIYCWHYKKPENLLTIDSQTKKSGSSIWLHIDSNKSDNEPIMSARLSETQAESNLIQMLNQPTNDPICCICANQRALAVARESGIVNMYSLPTLEKWQAPYEYKLRNRPFKMEINCASTRLASIDFGGVLTFFDFTNSQTTAEGDIKPGKIVENFEIKDVWDMKFSETNPALFVMMEKTKLRIFNDLESEEPIVFSGYICEFKDLEVKAVLLDEIIKQYDQLDKEFLVTLETKLLRDCRRYLQEGEIDKAQELIEANPHDKMWKMLAEDALVKLDLEVAEQAFVRFSYYPGIKFVKKLQKIQNNNLKMAEVSIYFGRYDEAEQRFRSIDRPDLIISMLKSIGEWNKVLHLMKSADSASDTEMNECWNAIGQQYFDKHNWLQAVNYFTQGRCYDKLVLCYYYLEDYHGLEILAENLPETSSLLPEIAEIFFNCGMCERAVFAYVKSDNVKKAIDCCIQLNQWQIAIELAKTHDKSDISGLLTRYAKQLLNNNCLVQAVELYRRAGCYLEAAKIMNKLTESESQKIPRNYQKLKKMSVLVGLLVEQHHDQNKQQAKSRLKEARGQDAASALNGMLQEESTLISGLSESRLLDRPWHKAEAYHFYLLAQRQLFERYYDAAMKTAKLLVDYEDVIPPKDIYSLLAICAIHNRAFGTCSKAFAKLENLNDVLTKKEKEAIIQLTFKIFTKYSPNDPQRVRDYEDSDGNYEGDAKIPTCVVSGQQISLGQFWMCPSCKHAALEDEINRLQNCALCHSPA